MTSEQRARYEKEVVQLKKLIAKEIAPTHNFFFYTARLNERVALLQTGEA
jgi:hypothetical protein